MNYLPRKVTYGSGPLRKFRISNLRAKGRYELTRLASPFLIRNSYLRGSSFELWGEKLPYFLHRYNCTWKNERAVEISAALSFLARRETGRTLEFGNVLKYYGLSRPRVIVDLYERATGVTNANIFDFNDRPFDTIVSISTVEHVGWDEITEHDNGAPKAIEHLLSLLAPGGRMFISAPLGVNPALDQAIIDGLFPSDRETVLHKTAHGWEKASNTEVRPYASCGEGAASLWMAEFSRSLSLA